MAKTQQQAFCHRCDEHTLHTRTVESVNHALHLLLIFFCCGSWLPFYLLLVALPQKKYPWLCSSCGQRMGHVPREVKLARKAEAAERKAAARAEKAERRDALRAEKDEQHARRIAERHQLATEKANRIAAKSEEDAEPSALRTSDGIALLKSQLGAAIGQANRPLKILAGEDEFLFRIYQGTAGIIGLIVALGVMHLAGRALGLF